MKSSSRRGSERKTGIWTDVSLMAMGPEANEGTTSSRDHLGPPTTTSGSTAAAVCADLTPPPSDGALALVHAAVLLSD